MNAEYGPYYLRAPEQAAEPATAVEALAALIREGPTAAAVRSYLSPGPPAKFDSPQARAEAQSELEAGG